MSAAITETVEATAAASSGLLQSLMEPPSWTTNTVTPTKPAEAAAAVTVRVVRKEGEEGEGEEGADGAEGEEEDVDRVLSAYDAIIAAHRATKEAEAQLARENSSLQSKVHWLTEAMTRTQGEKAALVDANSQQSLDIVGLRCVRRRRWPRVAAVPRPGALQAPCPRPLPPSRSRPPRPAPTPTPNPACHAPTSRSENLAKTTEVATAATSKAATLSDSQTQLSSMDIELKSKSKEVEGLQATVKHQSERIVALQNEKHTLQNKVRAPSCTALHRVCTLRRCLISSLSPT